VGAATTNGLIVGAGYALVALGIVLIYKATRQFNFAQGEIGTVATFVAWMLLERDLGWPISGTIAVLTGVAMGLAIERFVVRPLARSPQVTVLVATAGVALLAIALQIIIGEAKLRAIKPMLTGDGFTIAGALVKPQDLMIIAGLAVTGVVLFLFFRSPVGTALLATSQEPTAARIAGIDINQMSMLVWGVAALFGALAGLLFAPVDAFTPGFMTQRRLIPGFTAAVIGGITSLPGAVAGGFAIGLIESYFGHFLGESIRGADGLGVLIALLAVLVVRPQGLLGKAA
jgi:branched-chain amino acid transport system permease protein